jgi:hypothetical protein
VRIANGKGKTTRTDIVQIKTRAWTKSGSRKTGWKRVGSSRVDSTLNPMRNPLDDRSGVAVSSLITVGAETIGKIPVWHIRWTETSGYTSGTVDALIAQKGFLPYRTVRSLDDSVTGAHIDDHITRSRFGEKVPIAAPKG